MITKYIRLTKWSIQILLGVTFCCGCKKFIEVDAPYTSFNSSNVYSTDETAISAVTAMYAKLGTADNTLSGTEIFSVTYHTGLSGDELTLFPGNPTELSALYSNELTNSTAPLLWQRFYQQIYLANAALEGLTISHSLSSSVRNQLLGESKFMRAFCYFYLANLYGDVPLVTSTNYKNNSLAARVSKSQIWQQIISDLVEAKDLLNANYVGADAVTSLPTTERVRPSKWTASALLARAYLFSSDYVKAEAEATGIINNSSLFSLSTLNNAFLKDPALNKEAIWQIQPVTSGWNTNDGRVFILPPTGPGAYVNPVSLNKGFVYSFESNDRRRTNWINGIQVAADSFYYAYKYKSATFNAPVTEYTVVFRLAELYLIRAEAEANGAGGGTPAAIADLNVIRNRAGLLTTTASTKDELLTAILNERRHELFCEWGHRWLDLKRTNTVDAVMSMETPLKGGTWQSFDKLYPLPLSELNANPNLTQTPGY